MAEAAVVSTTAAGQQTAQATLMDAMAAPIASAFDIIDTSDPSTLATFLTAMRGLTRKFGLVSAAHAARFYTAERDAAGVSGKFTPTLAPTANATKVETSLRWATKDLWTGEPDLETARTNVIGVADKNVLDTGRLTTLDAVKQDRKAVGWAREVEPGACAFCLLLATRGAAYRSQGSSSFESHDHCRCIAVPVFSAYEPSADVRHWQSVYKESTKNARGSKASIAAFRSAVAAERSQPSA